MNLDETPEEAEFRREVRAWMQENVSPLSEDGIFSFADRREIDRRMAEAGYLGYTWPKEFGGAGGTPVFASILDEECSGVGAPRSLSPSRFGVDLLGPALIAHGTEQQRTEFLPRIRRADDVWCQGFSEPEAGSDLANVQCYATDHGDHLLLNGSKVWTTQAHEADWCFAIVRTDRAERHAGLSFVLIKMDQPGVTIRPIRQLTGDAEFNEVYFDNVRVEHAHVVGGLGGGWRVAMAVTGAERSYGQMSRYRDYLGQLRSVANMIDRTPDEASKHVWRQQVGQLAADLHGIRDLSYKITSLAAAGESLGTLPSITKLWWSTTHNRLLDLAEQVAVATGDDLDRWHREWLKSRAETIYAGTSQVQRNIIAERMLGLPR